MADEKSIRVSEDTLKRQDEILERVRYVVNKTHLPALGKCSPVDIQAANAGNDVAQTVCFFPIHQIVFDKKEDMLQKLASVYSGAAAIGATLAYMIRGYSSGETEMYLGVCDESDRLNGAYTKASALMSHFIGQFPGCRNPRSKILSTVETNIALNKCFDRDFQAVSAVSCVASLRKNQLVKDQNGFYQGIEKVIDAMNGSDYTILSIAKPLDAEQLNAIRSELETLYSVLSPFAKIGLTQNSSQTVGTTETMTETVSEGFTQNQSVSMSVGKSSSDSSSVGASWGMGGGRGGEGGFFSMNFGLNSSKGHSEGTSQSSGKNEGTAQNRGTSQGKSHGSNQSSTEGESVQLSLESKDISGVLENINLQLGRIRTGMGIGMFSSATYVLAATAAEARTIACVYKANVTGDNSNLESSAINIWGPAQSAPVLEHLRRFHHPVFRLDRNKLETTPATLVTSPELAIEMSIPQKSVNGIPVRESIAFGRNVTSFSSRQGTQIDLGSIYHLGHVEKTPVQLDLDSLTMHTFVTGTTGSGKSNTLYGLIERIRKARPHVHFLVVEPAKGEYKTVFAAHDDVKVYGVNPYITPLLRINPFRFRKGIHVLEHLDRLISIFNVCWPMEAAMPAILKQGMERAYERAGWELSTSRNECSETLFPSFEDVMYEIERILEESQYSEENKGNYIGALCTRLRELTTGLNGMLFTADDLSDEQLFEENVIVDLSRLGAAETKSLIMGLLVIRLQEYRITEQRTIGQKLSHLTVLEEAHHLLRRTSGAPSGGADLAGKSVEMLTNAFAEMRSAGEGFIIADQSPGQMDMSVIRNTNTKIVMRLPAHEDREMLGRAMGLSDMQIAELAKLPTGVGATYQNDWVEAVLTQIPYYPAESARYQYQPDHELFENRDKKSLLDAMMHADGIERMVDRLTGNRIEAISRMQLNTIVKRRLIEYVRNTSVPKLDRLGRLAFEFFNVYEAINHADGENMEEFIGDLLLHLDPSIAEYSQWEQETLLMVITYECARRNRAFEPLYREIVSRLI